MAPHTTPSKIQHNEAIQVYVRVRPQSAEERAAKSRNVVNVTPGQPDKEVVVTEKGTKRGFNFDRVFDDISKQKDVFQCVAQPLIKQVLRGYNCTVFAYGQTGTGKTYTMEGLSVEAKESGSADWQTDPTAGIIPRSLCEIFDAKAKIDNGKNMFQIKVSFLELYNEEIFDLLSKHFDPEKKHKIFEDSAKKGSVIVQGLEEVVVENKQEVLRILEEGSLRRTTAATKMNASSSRSHTVFTITVTITEKSIVGQEKYVEGKLNLVDLAGSENVGRSGAVAQRAREAGEINRSLLTLGRVINKLVDKEKHIPYRESKLTRLLQDSLGGKTKTSIIATVSPASINLEETLSTLQYAASSRKVLNMPEINLKIPVASKIAEMQSKMDALRRELDDQRDKDGGVFISEEKKSEMEEKVAQLEKLRKEHANLTELFGLKSEENEKLAVDLKDTLKQLEDKSAVLMQTQEEKEVQEQLVKDHTRTESVMRDQGMQAIEVADQLSSDFVKLQDSRDRKSQVERHNLAASAAFQSASAGGMGRLEEWVGARDEAHTALCDTVRASRDEPVAVADKFTSAAVHKIAEADEELKQTMTLIDSLSADHMHSEQTFLSAALKSAQAATDARTEHLQKHLTNTIAQTAEVEAAMQRQTKSKDALVASIREHLSLSDSQTVALKEFVVQMAEAAGKKQERSLFDARKMYGALLDRIDGEKSEIDHQIKRVDEREQSLTTEIKRWHSETVSAFSERRETLEAIRKDAEGAFKEHADSVTATAASFRSITERSGNFAVQRAEANARAAGDVSDRAEELNAAAKSANAAGAAIADEEKSFVTGSQEFERSRFAAMESEFRTRSDEAPEQMRKIQDKTRSVLKTSSETRSKLQMYSDDLRDGLDRWRTSAAADASARCDAIDAADEKVREEIKSARHRESKYFKDDLRKDKPSGATPGRDRLNTNYPKAIVEGTPDDVRTRRYRGTRDVDAAAKLDIGGMDDDLEDSRDSVFSVSTNATEDYAASESAKTLSRQSSTDLVMSDGEDPKNRENKDPEPSRFIRPTTAGSKLRAPKVFSSSSSSSSGPAATRSRSSSRNRNVLASSNRE